MKVLLELTQEEGERLFEAVKGFTVDRMKTVEVSAPEDKPEKVPAWAETSPTNAENKPNVTLERLREVLTEKKRAGKDLKGLFSKFGAMKLTDVAPIDYASLLKEAERL